MDMSRYAQANSGGMFSMFAPPPKKKPSGEHPFGKHLPKFLELAQANKGEEVEYSALVFVMNMACDDDCPESASDDIKAAAARVVERYRDDRRILAFLRSGPRPKLIEAKKLLGRLAKESKDEDIRAIAAYMFARCLDVNAEGGRYRSVATKAARMAVDSKSEITYRGKPVSQAAESYLEMLTKSAVGIKAPRLNGVDQNKKPVSLAEYKGQYVAVAFYTKQSEFHEGIARQLNDVKTQLKDANVGIIGVQFEYPNSYFRSSGSQPVKKTWRFVHDGKEGVNRKAWHIASDPTVFLIDKQGVIAGRFVNRGKPASFNEAFFGSMFGAKKTGTWKNELFQTLVSLDPSIKPANTPQKPTRGPLIVMPKPTTAKPATPIADKGYPENDFYKMVSSNRIRASKQGQKIIAKFERKGEVPEGMQLRLVLQPDGTKYSDSPGAIIVRDNSTNTEIVRFKKIARNQTRKVPLSIQPGKTIEISVASAGSSYFRLRRFGHPPIAGSDGIPTLYLEAFQPNGATAAAPTTKPAAQSATNSDNKWKLYQMQLRAKEEFSVDDPFAPLMWTVTTTGNLYSSDTKAQVVKRHDFDKLFSTTNIAVKALQPAKQWVWAGTDRGLFRYSRATKAWEKMAINKKHAAADVKALSVADGMLVVTYDANQTARYDLMAKRWK
jgi:peroxiredoxin